MSSTDGAADEDDTVPRAVVHKNILDAAESNPDASIETLTSFVSGASVALVERVLEEYGDPAAPSESVTDDESPSAQSPQETPVQEHSSSMSNASNQDAVESDAELNSVTAKQREILEAIRSNPDATQQEIAEAVDSSQATVSNHLRSVPGFDWQTRREFVDTMTDDETHRSGTDEAGEDDVTDDETHRSAADEAGDDAMTPALRAVAEQVEALEARVAEQSCPDSAPFDDVALASKVIHACIESETISQDEELEIIESIIDRDPRQ